jgi:hypothetical protein
MAFDEILEIAPYSLGKEEKKTLLTERLFELTRMHRQNCREYADMLDCISFDENKAVSYEDLPYLPVRLFKEMDLKSVPGEAVVKTMTSSGTTGQKTSKIYLDRTTASNQQKVMVKIVSDFTGAARMPMIIIDSPSVLKDRKKFSARGAGILGFSVFGTKKIYALDDNMKLDVDGMKDFLEQHRGEKILLFGFTFMIWQHFYKELVRLREEGTTFDLSQGILIHGGGWKKLQSEAVSQQEFHDRLKAVCGIDRVHDYYGMVEQTGCIYMQCECGHLHTSIFSDVIARRPKDFSICDVGEPGILQVISTIPESYPGHSLLTEDEGVILGEDDCPCGRKGKYFKLNGRIAKAEIRGCSDTYAADQGRQMTVDTAPESEPDMLSRVEFLAGDRRNIGQVTSLAVKRPFDDHVVDFLNALSHELMSQKEARQYPDVVTLGFWLRKSSVLAMKERFVTRDGMVGRGVAFHIAPSNVPVNYAYSLFTGLLCGNANIVRIPSKDFPQVSIINRMIHKVMQEPLYSDLAPYISLVRYERNREINDYFSSLCDVRVIWGGDSTVSELRKSPISARATEITFADRYSLAVIDSEAYLENQDKAAAASGFYNDTYLSDQNACTSPRVVVWLGNHREEAREMFWSQICDLAEKRYSFQAIQGVDKLSQLYRAAVEYPGVLKEDDGCTSGNVLYRVKVHQLEPRLMDYRGNSGYFYEYDCGDVMELRAFCNNTHCQTIGFLGDASRLKPLLDSGIKGVDRVVPIGQTMNFDLIWDGYNLVEQMTRVVAV